MKKSLFRSVVCSVEINIVTHPSHFAPVKPTKLASSKAGVSCFFFPTNTTSQNSWVYQISLCSYFSLMFISFSPSWRRWTCQQARRRPASPATTLSTSPTWTCTLLPTRWGCLASSVRLDQSADHLKFSWSSLRMVWTLRGWTSLMGKFFSVLGKICRCRLFKSCTNWTWI